MPPLVLALAAPVALLCRARGYRGVALFIAVLAACDAARALLAPLRHGYPLPYEGRAFVLWLACELLPCLLPLGVMAQLGCGVRPWPAVAALFAGIALAYPTVRGPALLFTICALYGAVYALSVLVQLWRGARRGELGTEGAMIVALALTGCASIMLVRVFGVGGWVGAPITYAAGLLAVGLLAARGPRSDHGSSPQDG